MSADALAAVFEVHALDPVPARTLGDLGPLHVPFDELVGRHVVERPLATSIEVASRVAVQGVSGAGKSSVFAHCFGPMVEHWMPVFVYLAGEDAATVQDPCGVARIVIQAALRQASLSAATHTNILRASADHVAAPGEQSRIGGRVSLKVVEASKDVTRLETFATQARAAGEVIEALDEVLAAIRAHKLLPVLVFDDTDSWLDLADNESRSERAEGFFGDVLRMLAERPAALAVAVHDQYGDLTGFSEARALGLLEQSIPLPHLPGPEAFRSIVSHRLAAHQLEADVFDVFHEDAFELVATYYEGRAGYSIRKAITVLNDALVRGHHAGMDLVTRELIETALVDF